MKWFAVWLAVQSAYTTFAGGLLSLDVINRKAAGVMMLAGASVQAGTAAYVAALSKQTQTVQEHLEERSG